MSDLNQNEPDNEPPEFAFASGRLRAAIQQVQASGLSRELLTLCVASHMLKLDDLNNDLACARQELKAERAEHRKHLEHSRQTFRRLTADFEEFATQSLPEAIVEQVAPMLAQLRTKWLAEQRTSTAKKAAAAKLQNDDKQRAKDEIKALWLQYQAGRATFKSGADFARHAVEKCPAITSVKSVERWVTEWRKEQKNTH